MLATAQPWRAFAFRQPGRIVVLHREGQHGAGAIPHDARFAADLMEPAVQVKRVAQREGVAQIVCCSERLGAACQCAVGVALPQQDQRDETAREHPGLEAPWRIGDML